MNNAPKFYFFSNRYAIRYHISKRLLERGWEKAERSSDAIFTDQNLILNDEISKNLEYKHLLAYLVKKHCSSVMPVTYCINDDNYLRIFSEIIYHFYTIDGKYEKIIPHLKWILKPSLLNNGDQIKLFNNIEEIKQYYTNTNRLGGEHVLQQYIADPDLIDGRKYTFRIPVILTNYAGVFLYRKGYVNISAFPYDPKEPFLNKKMHITNYVLDGELSKITQRPSDQLDNFDSTFNRMSEIVRQCIRALLKEYPAYLRPDQPKRFEIFGFDFVMDSSKRIWLLEINQGPDAPMYEDNAMKEILWNGFWENIIEDFVLPIANNTVAKNQFRSFSQVLSPSQCYSTVRHWLNRLLY